jgi:hypothetical protein
MVTFFRDGGFVMFPILLAGFVLTAVSALQALRPLPHRWRTLRLLAGVVTTLGLLGFNLAVVVTLRGSHDAPDHDTRAKIIIGGLAESANNLTLMLVFLLISAVVCAVAASRERAAS